MSEEQMDINSPEARSHMYNMMLALREAAEAAVTLADTIQSMDFKDITPEKWAQLRVGIDVVRPLHEFVKVSVDNSGVLMDDPEMMAKVQQYALDEMERES